jgi:tRNA 2-thiocytidine biosynthesis protein TtcA
VVPSHLADSGLFDFIGLTQQTIVEEGATAFDPVELPSAPRAETVRLIRPGADED